MIILSNAFPTNMPNSEEVSQGGPANFARLFSRHIAATTTHKWIGVIFHASKLRRSKTIRLKKVFSSGSKDYFKLYFPRKVFKKITRAKKVKDPAVILSALINRTSLLIRKEKPDIVFLNGFGIFNWVLLKAAEKTNTPCVIQHAGIWTKELRLHKHLYSVSGIKIMEKMEEDSSRLSSAEVFLNSWSMDYYRKNVSKEVAGKSVIIPLPFDFESFNNLSQPHKDSITDTEKSDVFKIGAIARWDKIKNHGAILSLAKTAARLNLPWQFYAVTKVPDSHYLSRAYKKNIEIIPSLDRKGISDFCNSMNMMLLPSLFDVSPTVALEAVATKTPIAISDNVGYVYDFKQHGAREWVVDFKDKVSALDRIKKLTKKSLPESLRKKIIQKHDHKKVFSAYMDLFYETATQG